METGAKEEKVYKLACKIISYETDPPHVSLPHIDLEEEQYYPEYTVEELKEHLAEDHHGDCVNVPMTCMRCTAEVAVHKAKWLIENFYE